MRTAYADLAEAHARAEAGEREKDLLLAELMHRTRNDLQRMVGLLRLQASTASEMPISDALRGAADRVEITARLHERLSRRDGRVVVDSQEFLTRLAEDLRASLDGLWSIELFIEAEAHPIPIARAGAVGLVLNELATNALKHAFPDHRPGAIWVAFRRVGAEYELAVADDGVGMQERVDAGPSSRPCRGGAGLGRRLVRGLAAQLGGRLEVIAGEAGGTVCTLRFPVDAPL